MKRTRWLLTTIVCLILCVIGGAAIADSPNLDSGIRLDAVATYVPGENTPLTVAICDANDVMGDWKTNQHWSLTLSDPWGDTVFWRIEGEENAPNVLYTVPSNVVLSPGQIYKFRFEMDLQEYDLVDDEAYFVVMEEPAETQPNLDISIGQAGMDNYSSSAQQEKTANILYSVRIQKDDSITAVKVMNRDHWEYICGDDSYEREWRWEAGESVLMAFGTTEQIDPEAPGFEWENLNWNVSSNVISLIVKAEQGRLAKPTLTVEGAYSYTRGDMLTVTLSKVTGGVWYYVRVFKTNNGESTWDPVYSEDMEVSDNDGVLTYIIPTNHIPAGNYVVWGGCSGIDYRGNGADEIPITVTDGAGQVTAAVIVTPNTIATNQSAQIYGYAPNAELIKIEISREDIPEWRIWQDFEEEYGIWYWGDIYRGEYNVKLYADDSEEPVAMAPLTMLADEENDLAETVITGFEDTYVLSDDLTVSGSFNVDPNAEWYNVELVYRGLDGYSDYDFIREEHRDENTISGTITYDHTAFDRPGVYAIYVTGAATGWNGTGGQKLVTIYPPAQQDSPVHLSCEEAVNDVVTAPIYSAVRYQIAVDQWAVDRIKDIRFLNAYEEQEVDMWQIWERGFADAWWSPDREETVSQDYPVYACALIAGENGDPDYWVYSNRMTVRVTMNETLTGNLTFTVVSPTLQQGQTVIEVPKDGMLVLAANNIGADYYDAYINEAGRHISYIADSRWVTAESGNTTTVSMPVFECEVGKEYDVSMFAVKVGAEKNYSTQTVRIKVVEKAAANPTPIILNMTGDTFETDEQIRIYASYENPDDELDEEYSWINVKAYPANKQYCFLDENGDGFYYWTDSMRIGAPGDYIVEAVVMTNGGDWEREAWEVEGTLTTKQFHVSGTKGNLTVPNVTISPIKTKQGADHNDVTITFGTTPNAERYTYWIHSGDNYTSLKDGEFSQPRTVTIDPDQLEPNVYWVEASVYARGYVENYRTFYFVVMDPYDTEMSPTDGSYYFSCNATPATGYSETDFTAQAGEDIRFTYYVPGAEEVNLGRKQADWDYANGFAHHEAAGLTQWRRFDKRGSYEIYGSYRMAGSDEWSEETLLCTIQVSAEGSLGRPWVDMPMVVNAGDDIHLQYHVDPDEPIQEYSFWLSFENDGGYEYGECITSNKIDWAKAAENGNVVDLVIPADRLQANRLYHVYLDVDAVGWEQGHDDRQLYVLGEAETDPSIVSISGPDEIVFSQSFAIEVNAPDAQDTLIWWQTANDYRYTEGEYARQWYCQDWNPGEGQYNVNSDTCSFYAIARYDENWLKVSPTINIPFNRQNVGDAEAPTLSIENTGSITRGQFITANVGEIQDQDVTEYQVYVTDMNDQWIDFVWSETAGQILVPTNHLNPGSYKLRAYARVPGKFRTDSEAVPVTITEAESSAFIVTKTQVQVCEPLAVSVIAPGADRIRFSGGYDEWWNVDGWDGDSWYSNELSWNHHEDEDIVIRAEALYNGTWVPVGENEGEMHITVTAEGDLEAPDLSGILATTPAGQEMVFTFDAVEHADTYEFEVIRLSDGRRWGFTMDWDGTDPDTMIGTIPADLLTEANEGYAIQFTTFGLGYNASYCATAFVTVPTTVAQREITLSADQQEIESNNGNVHFTVNAAGASLVRIYYDGRWDWTRTDDQGTAEFELCFNQAAPQPVWADACYDNQYAAMTDEDLSQIDMSNVAFEGMSNIVTIQVYSQGETYMPQWMSVQKQVTWGEWLRIDIGGEGNAETLHIRIGNEDNDEIWFEEVHEIGTTYYLPTTELEPGGDYSVFVNGVRGGYMWNSMDGDYRFHVNPRDTGENDQPFMTSDRPGPDGWVIVNEPYYVQIYAPGAIGLMAVNADDLEDINGIWEGSYGESGRGGFRWMETGRHTLNGYAQYTENGEWQLIGSVTLDVLERDLDAPEIRVASVTSNDNTLDIIVPLIGHGEYYTLDIHEVNGDGPESRKYHQDMEASQAAKDPETNEWLLTYTIPEGTLSNGGYWIDCYVGPDHRSFNGSEAHKSILVMNGTAIRDDQITLSVDRMEVLVHERFTVTAGAPGAKAIMIYWGDQSRGFTCDRNGSIQVELDEYQEATEILYARAYYNELPDGYFDWNTLTWSNPSSATIIMQFIAYGPVGEPEFGAPECVQRGDILTVDIFYEGDGANETHANILLNQRDDNFENWMDPNGWFGWNEQARQIYLPTSGLEPGTYWLAVDNSGIGHTGNRRWHQFEVTANEAQPQTILFDAPERALLGQPLPVSVYAPEAVHVGFAMDGQKWHEDEQGQYQWGETTDTWYDMENVRWDDPMDIGTHTITAYATFDGTTWKTQDITVTVEDPQLDAPEIQVEDVANNTGDMYIDVPLVGHGWFYNLDIHPANILDEASYTYRERKTAEEAYQDAQTGEWRLTFTVPAGKLDNGTYWIDCYAGPNEPGYFGSEAHRSILVHNSGTRDNKIALSVDRNEVEINSRFTVTASAAGAKAILILCGDQSWGFVCNENGQIEGEIGEYQPGVETLYALACYDANASLPSGDSWNFDWDSLTWGDPSDQTIQMRFISYGSAGEANYDAPGTVVRGDILTISNIQLGDGANEAHANINQHGPGEEELRTYDWCSWDEETRTILLPTTMLVPGEYWIMVDNSGIGRENSRRWHKFTVLARDEIPENGVFVSMPAKTQTGRIVPISVYAPGAVKTGFGIDMPNDIKDDPTEYGQLLWNGDYYADVRSKSWDEAGTHTVTAYAQFADGDTVRTVHIDQTVTICEPLNFNLSGLPGYFEIGQAATNVTIPLPLNAEGMNIHIHADSENGSTTLYEDEGVEQSKAYTISADYLVGGYQIMIDCTAYATGFADVYNGACIKVEPAYGTGATLTARDERQLDDPWTASEINTIQTNEPVRFRVTPTQGHTLTRVQFFEGHGYWEEVTRDNHPDWFEDDGSAYFVCNYNHNDDPNLIMNAYAKYELDGGGGWYTTNCLKFTVSTPNGLTGGYDFADHSPITANRGEIISVTFTDVEYPEGPIHYWADIFGTDGRSYNPRTSWDNNTVMISTANIPAGEYSIIGRAVKDTEPGWRWSESYSSRKLIISDGTETMPTAGFVTPAALQEIEEEAFAGIGAQTVEITENVQWINSRAFAESSVETVIIRNGGTWIDDNAFAGCGIITVFAAPESNVQYWAERNLYTFYPIQDNE